MPSFLCRLEHDPFDVKNYYYCGCGNATYYERGPEEVPRPNVEGFIYLHPEDPNRDGQIVQIITREKADPLAALPTFRVIFDDGEESLAVSHQLHPWYPSEPELAWMTETAA